MIWDTIANTQNPTWSPVNTSVPIFWAPINTQPAAIVTWLNDLEQTVSWTSFYNNIVGWEGLLPTSPWQSINNTQ
jgi:hypothetical protein